MKPHLFILFLAIGQAAAQCKMVMVCETTTTSSTSSSTTTPTTTSTTTTAEPTTTTSSTTTTPVPTTTTTSTTTTSTTTTLKPTTSTTSTTTTLKPTTTTTSTTTTVTTSTTTTVTTTTTPGPLGCGEHTISSGQIYAIESPNYPDKYAEDDSCKWEITCDENAGVISISCDEFKTEEDDPCKDADYLKVSDSTGTIDFYCGKTGPDLESADNYLELKFKTDKDTTVKRGFSCSLECTIKTTTTSTTITTTSSTITTTSTTTPMPTTTTTSTTTTPEPTTTTTVSTSTTTTATTTTTPGPLGCGEHTITTGEIYPIESPNYPDKYGEEDSCKWEITCDENSGVIGLSCDDFKTEEDDPCKDADYLKVSDSTGTIDYYCGKTAPDLESSDNYLELKFKTDKDTKVKSGFSCSLVCTLKTTTTSTSISSTAVTKPMSTTTLMPTTTTAGPLACGEHTISAGETYPIESPNYPDKYGETDSCKWEITCDENAGVIEISCDEFKTEEDDKCKKADYLKVSDSTGTIDYFCGKTGPDLASADNFLELKFKTDEDSKVKTGFSCSLVCKVQTTTVTTTVQPTTTTPGPLACGEHTVSVGEMYAIESPNYPDKYGEEDSCKWEITCDENSGVIGVSCDEFKTEEDDPCKDADYLKVSDSTGTIDFYCGKTGPDLESADNYLELKFKTDKDSKVKSGFSCSIVCTVKTTTTAGPTTLSPTPTLTPTTMKPTTPKPTTTVDPDKTTTVEPTTTPAGGWGGNCSKTITASHGMTEYWVSPKYNGTTHYPKGEYCCSLNITIPKSFNMFMVNMEMQSPSSIHETSQCVHDFIEYHSADGHKSTLCGTLAGQTWSEVQAYNGPREFSFTWCSTNADGATDIGFKMEITGKDLEITGGK